MPRPLFYTHVNRQVIDRNTKHGTAEPAITVRRGKRGKAIYAHEVELPAGARMIYSPHDPLLACGARLVIVSESEPRVLR